jgi:hypothetical protein
MNAMMALKIKCAGTAMTKRILAVAAWAVVKASSPRNDVDGRRSKVRSKCQKRAGLQQQ